MIHTTIWSSGQVSKLSVEARLLYIGTITLSDDDGRLKGNPAFLRSQIFPYDDLTTDQVRKWLDEIVKIGLITVYNIDDDDYLYHPNWKEYQTLRADRKKESHIPSPNCQPSDNQVVDISPPKVSKGKVSKDNNSDKSQVNIEIAEIIDTFKLINENYKTFFGNKTQRKAVITLLSLHSRQAIEKYIYLAKFSFNNQFFPNFISPYELQIKWVKIDKFCTTKQINDKRYLQDFENYYIDLVKKNNPPVEKQIVEATIGGRKVKYELNK